MRYLMLLMAGLWPLSLCADIYWQPEASPPGQQHGRALGVFTLAGSASSSDVAVTLIHPDRVRSALTLTHQQVQLRPSGKNSYHALLAQQDTAQVHYSAVRYLYLNGRPTGISPDQLLAEPLAPLQIIPDPLPREHWRYESGRTYYFRLALHGQPLADQALLATTSNGASQVLHSDDQGRISLLIPDDFAEVVPGRGATPPAQLRLFTSWQTPQQTYHSSLSADYHPNPAHWQRTLWGSVVIALGMGGGLLLGRRIPGQQGRKKR